jgi:hypothetical protein
METRLEADPGRPTDVNLRQLCREPLAWPPAPGLELEVIHKPRQVSAVAGDGEEEKLAGAKAGERLAGHHPALKLTAQRGWHFLDVLPDARLELPDLDAEEAIGILHAAHEQQVPGADDDAGRHDVRGHGDGHLVPGALREVVGDERERGERECEAVEDPVAPHERVPAVLLRRGRHPPARPPAGCRVINLRDHRVILQPAADENPVRVGLVAVHHPHRGDHPRAHGRQPAPRPRHRVQHRHPWPLEIRIGKAQQPSRRRHHMQVRCVERNRQPQPCLQTWQSCLQRLVKP